MSPARTAVEGFAGLSLTRTWPPRHAVAASARVFSGGPPTASGRRASCPSPPVCPAARRRGPRRHRRPVLTHDRALVLELARSCWPGSCRAASASRPRPRCRPVGWRVPNGAPIGARGYAPCDAGASARARTSGWWSGGPAACSSRLDLAGLRTVFQPIVDLATGGVVATRPSPAGRRARRPDPEDGSSPGPAHGGPRQFDGMCRLPAPRPPWRRAPRAVDAVPQHRARRHRGRAAAARGGGVHAARRPARPRVHRAGADGRPGPRAVVRHAPAPVGIAVALDDVGSHPSSLALMPFLRPEVVKLDQRLVQDPSTTRLPASPRRRRLRRANDAIVLAEGVETAGHERTARALAPPWSGLPLRAAAALAPTPAPPPAADRRPPAPPRAPPASARSAPSPAAAGSAAARSTRSGSPRRCWNAGRSRPRDQRSSWAGGPRRGPDGRPGRALRVRGGALRASSPCSASGPRRRGVRGAALTDDDPLRTEWDVAVVGPHVAAALVARPSGDGGTGVRRRLRARPGDGGGALAHEPHRPRARRRDAGSLRPGPGSAPDHQPRSRHSGRLGRSVPSVVSSPWPG